MFENRIKELVLSTIVADSYCLGSHWIYDEKDLKNLKIDWMDLNNACSIWHKGKIAGELTHYGDQNYFFYEYIKDKKTFDVNDYLEQWAKKMSVYGGYVDGASRETLENLRNKKESPYGSNSHDLSIVSRIPALLNVSSNKEEFLKNVLDLTQATHNSALACETTKFFSLILLDVLNSNSIMDSILKHKEDFSSDLQKWIKEGIESKNANTLEKIREFGPACSISDGFAGVIHLLSKYDNFTDSMIFNAKAGGDNSARAMIVAMLLVAKNGASEIPVKWLKTKVQI